MSKPRFRTPNQPNIMNVIGKWSRLVRIPMIWYDIDTAKYQGTKVTVGLALSDWKLVR